MRFMVIVKSTPESETGAMPTPEQLAEMGRFNEELIKAGILLAAEGLTASKEGARVCFEGSGKTTIKDGPFTESKELVAGFWIIQVKDRDEALAWARRIPFEEGEVEVRRVSEVSDFVSDEVSDPYLEREQAWRDANQKPIS
ncbi:YciI family protein [Paradevosia shaoguanensis]|uniref:YciI family protein n=1 Tax=Paradevosia shaoguanensis TaxID=1335043 RepID=UPI003C7357BD